ncbi:MAG: pentapeptide repeat-containing protein [Acidobacteria bacterium]|nr:pentapeptide repeat-containing protein [Acidobacteriota bacterium]
MAIEILSRYTGAILYSSATAETIAKAVVEAARSGDLYGANLYGANLYGANLEGANLEGANLEGANLYGAKPRPLGANLYGANLYGANLVRANLYGANLYGANLYGANLVRANLEGANLEGANLVRANLYGANLEGAKTSDTTKIDRVAITLVGSRHVITAYSDRVRIGCQERSYGNWLEVYKSVGKMEGYTAEQIEEYGGLILRAQAMFAASGKAVEELA